MSVFNCLGLL